MGNYTDPIYREELHGDLSGIDGTMFGLGQTIAGSSSLSDFDMVILDNTTFNGAAAHPDAPAKGERVYYTITAQDVADFQFLIDITSDGAPDIAESRTAAGGSITISGSFVIGDYPAYISIVGMPYAGAKVSYELTLTGDPSPTYDLGTIGAGSLTLPGGVLGANEERTYTFTVGPTPLTLYSALGNAQIRAAATNIDPTLWPGESGISSSRSGRLDENLMPGEYTLTVKAGATPLKLADLHLYNDFAGNSPYWAQDLGTMIHNETASTLVTGPDLDRVDTIDYYKFTLTEPSVVAITLGTETSAFTNGLRIFMDDAASAAAGASGIPTGFSHYLPGSAEQYATIISTSGRSIALPAGTYYFEATGPSPVGGGDHVEFYNVFVSAWADGGGNTATTATALDLSGGGELVLEDHLNVFDADDYYAFRVDGETSVEFTLKANNANTPINLQLISAENGLVHDDFDNPGTLSGGIGQMKLDAGLYYLRAWTDDAFATFPDFVFDQELEFPDGGGSDYTLTVRTTPDPWYARGADLGVAASTYQFFTGSVPTGNGFEYLVFSPGNATDLNDPYYAQFNLENLYINFANNLGSFGAGAADFNANYGSLSFEETVRKAYDEIIGIAYAEARGIDTDAAIQFFLNARSFYESVANERVVSSGVPLAQAIQVVAVGSILHEAIKAGVGQYADEVEALVTDLLADGQSPQLGKDLFAMV